MRLLVRKLKSFIVAHESPWHDQWYGFASNRKNRYFKWRSIEGPPLATVESGGVVVGKELFAVAGYGESLEEVRDCIQVFDLENERWIDPIPIPQGFAHSHHGIATDGARFIYFAGGQIGPNCGPCMGNVFVFDVKKREWRQMLSLPSPRYAPVVEIARGRLHVIAGNRSDRFTGMDEHLSMGLGEGSFTEDSWKIEAAIPRGGHHRASVANAGCIYVFAGQEGDVRPIEGDPEFVCDWSTPEERFYCEVHRFDPSTGEWEELAPIPKPVTHAEFSVVNFRGQVYLFGGLIARSEIIDTIYSYDLDRNLWKEAGSLPYPLKGHLAFEYKDAVFVFSGQKSRMPGDHRPGKVLRSGWKSKLPRSEDL